MNGRLRYEKYKHYANLWNTIVMDDITVGPLLLLRRENRDISRR